MLNRAPALLGPGRLTPVREDAPNPPGDTVQALLGSTFRDSDPGARGGIAIVGATGAGHGRWQFSLDGGRSWSDLGGVSPASARLLRSTDRVRFLPAADFNGSVLLLYHAWDQTSGTAGGWARLSVTGGTSAFGAQMVQARLPVAAVNDAPVLTGSGRLTLVPAGKRVRDILAGVVRDIDGLVPAGLAVVGATGAGRWQVSHDGGRSWSDLGAVSTTRGRLLGPDDRIRFLPQRGRKGTARLLFRVWDRTSGSVGGLVNLSTGVGGSTAFSKQLGEALVSFAAVV